MKKLLIPLEWLSISDKVQRNPRLKKSDCFKTHVFPKMTILPHGDLTYQHKFMKANIEKIAFGSGLAFCF
ncbi:hypothetical protein [Bartonella jaculi]|uniref:Uncharacterized protein n=1 Tax=Bartonella jaculi TaxID=686226 RepID=A0ABP9N8E6_9HYPH